MPMIVVAPAIATAASTHGRLASSFFERMIDFGSATRDVDGTDGSENCVTVG
jgi:hypothetical protein